MSKFLGHVNSINPVLANDNFAFDLSGGESGKVYELRFSGEATSTVAMATRFGRTADDGTVPVPGNVQKRHPNSTQVLAFVASWTGQPTLDAGALLWESWNAFGGVVRWQAGPDEEFVMIGAEQLSCRGSVGTGISSYRAAWEED